MPRLHTATTTTNADAYAYATIAPDIRSAGSDLKYKVSFSPTHVEVPLGSDVAHDGQPLADQPWVRFLDEQVGSPQRMDSRQHNPGSSITGLNAMD